MTDYLKALFADLEVYLSGSKAMNLDGKLRTEITRKVMLTTYASHFFPPGTIENPYGYSLEITLQKCPDYLEVLPEQYQHYGKTANEVMIRIRDGVLRPG